MTRGLDRSIVSRTIANWRPGVTRFDNSAPGSPQLRETLKKVQLELGCNNPLVILNDAELEAQSQTRPPQRGVRPLVPGIHNRAGRLGAVQFKRYLSRSLDHETGLSA